MIRKTIFTLPLLFGLIPSSQGSADKALAFSSSHDTHASSADIATPHLHGSVPRDVEQTFHYALEPHKKKYLSEEIEDVVYDLVRTKVTSISREEEESYYVERRYNTAEIKELQANKALQLQLLDLLQLPIFLYPRISFPDWYRRAAQNREHDVEKLLPAQQKQQIVEHMVSRLRPCEVVDSLATYIQVRTHQGHPQEQEIKLSHIRSLKGHTMWFDSVAFTPDGKLLATGNCLEEIRVWDSESGQCKRVLQGHRGGVQCLCFDPTQTCLVGGFWDGNVRIWNITSGQCMHVLEGHTEEVNSIALYDSEDGKIKRIASTSKDSTIIVWERNTDRWYWYCKKTLTGQLTFVNGVAFTSDGQHLISTSKDGKVHEWDIERGRVSKDLADHRIRCFAFEPAQNLLATGDDDGSIRLLDLNGNISSRVGNHSMPISDLFFQQNGTRLISVSYDRTVKTWEIESNKCLQTLAAYDNTLTRTRIFFHPSQPWRIFTSDRSGDVNIWELYHPLELTLGMDTAQGSPRWRPFLDLKAYRCPVIYDPSSKLCLVDEQHEKFRKALDPLGILSQPSLQKELYYQYLQSYRILLDALLEHGARIEVTVKLSDVVEEKRRLRTTAQRYVVVMTYLLSQYPCDEKNLCFFPSSLVMVIAQDCLLPRPCDLALLPYASDEKNPEDEDQEVAPKQKVSKKPVPVFKMAENTPALGVFFVGEHIVGFNASQLKVWNPAKPHNTSDLNFKREIQDPTISTTTCGSLFTLYVFNWSSFTTLELDLRNNEPKCVQKKLFNYWVKNLKMKCVSLDHAGTQIAAGFASDWDSMEEKVQICDLHSQKYSEIQSELKSNAYPTGLAFSNDDSLLAAGYSNQSLRLFGKQKDGTYKILKRHDLDSCIVLLDAKIQHLAFSPDRRLLATAVRNEVWIWHLDASEEDDWKPASKLTAAPEDWTGILAWSPDSKFLASRHRDVKINVWSLLGNNHTPVSTYKSKKAKKPNVVSLDMTQPLSGNHTLRIAIGHASGEVFLWEVKTARK